MFIVDVTANKHQIKLDVEECYVAKVNALLKSDRKKKAWICPTAWF